jgi:hypothetical protein
VNPRIVAVLRWTADGDLASLPEANLEPGEELSFFECADGVACVLGAIPDHAAAQRRVTERYGAAGTGARS